MNSVNNKQRGFTLIEVMIALSLATIVLAMAIQGINFVGKTWNKVEYQVSLTEKYYFSGTAARRLLKLIAPYRPDLSRDEILFSGQHEQLEFVGQLPHYLSTGLYQMRLSLQKKDEKHSLVLFYRPISAINPQFEQVVLFDDIERMTLEYYGSADGIQQVATWSDDWNVADRLPKMIKLNIFLKQDHARTTQLPVFNVISAPGAATDA